MTLTHIAIFILLALVTRMLRNRSVFIWLMLVASLLFIFWLQPVSTIRSLEFWMPALLIAIITIVWGIVSPKESLQRKENRITLLAATALISLIGLLRYLNIPAIAKIVNPPEIWKVLILWIIAIGMLYFVQKMPGSNKTQAMLAIFTLILIFIVLKYLPLTLDVSKLLRSINGQSTNLANSREIAWVGYSYFAFRLLHVLREWQQGRKINPDLREFIIYVIYFPAFTAGPIDRLEHFQKELENRDRNPVGEDWLEGGQRIACGLFRKFILADSLAIIAINPISAMQVNQTPWMWVMVYAYAFRLYLDFSGYTDIAIGISRLMGIQLPENFKKPYLSENVTVFWNRWHITLTQWFRTYYFNPVTRSLRSREKPISAGWIIFFTQITTMILIALWHGISLNFVIWGLWNGMGLFIHNRWVECNKSRVHSAIIVDKNAGLAKLQHFASIFLTFNFIALGWVWFAIPDLNTSLAIFSRLFGGS